MDRKCLTEAEFDLWLPTNIVDRPRPSVGPCADCCSARQSQMIDRGLCVDPGIIFVAVDENSGFEGVAGGEDRHTTGKGRLISASVRGKISTTKRAQHAKTISTYDHIDVSHATHYVRCTQNRRGKKLPYLMKCAVINAPATGKCKIISFGVRWRTDADHVKHIRYVDRERIIKMGDENNG